MADRAPEPSTLSRDALSALVERLRAGAAGASAERIGRRRGSAVPSFAQERQWFLDQLEGASATYNVPGALRFRGPCSVAALEDSLALVVRRHETLRSAFPAGQESGGPRLAIRDEVPIELPRVDLSRLGPADRERAASRLCHREARRPFDLARAPLLRAHLLRLEAGDHVLSLVLHHIVCDGWSLEIFLADLAALYGPALAGGPCSLPELPIQYADYAAWQRERLTAERFAAQLEWWRSRLAEAPEELELPVDRPRPPARRFAGGRRELTIPPAVGAALRAVAGPRRASPFMVLLAGFGAALARWTGQRDLVVGSPVAGRDWPETQGLVGLFVNTLPLRLELADDPSFEDLVAEVRTAVLSAWEHAETPLEKLVEALVPRRTLAHSPLFQVLFVLQPEAPRAPDFPFLETALSPLETGTAKFDLTLELVPADGGFKGTFEYDRDLFDATTVGRFGRQLGALFEAVAAAPGTPLSRLPWLLAAERQQLLREWATAPRPRPAAACLHHLFRAQAARTPEATALAAGGRRWSYRELEARVVRRAVELAELGVGPEVRVGVCLPRTAELVVTLLAVLEAGGAYVPIDPAYPEARRELMLADSAAALLVSAQGVVRRTAAEPVVSAAVTGRNLAYLIYTSGSTGRPKGVAIEHRSAVALLAWAERVFGPEDLAGVLASTSVCFDLSVFELFAPLASGGAVILVDDVLALDGSVGAGAMTLLNTVPSALAELLRRGELPPAVRVVNVAGEPLRRSLAEQVHAAAPAVRLFNLYGPSEDTTYSTWASIPPGAGEPAIGRPVDGTEAYLLDRRLEPVAAGAVGELCLGGDGLARGYHRRAALTAERFVPDAWGGRPGARLYRTGDRARSAADGELRFLGRLDQQVKVRGFRIEPGEVEAALAALPGIAEAAVVARPEPTGDLGLAAFAVVREGRAAPAVLREGPAAPRAVELRRRLAAVLPAHLVPDRVTLLGVLPRLPNGKLDRAALLALPAAVEGAVPPGAAVAGPAAPVQDLLAAIWADVLGVAAVRPEDSFFDLGGHSLLATRVAARLRAALGLEVPVRALFEHPSLASLAAELGERLRGGAADPLPPIEPRPRPGELPLSFAQERLWLLDLLQPDQSATYTMSAAYRLTGELAALALEQAVGEVARRHEALRTTFHAAAGCGVQRVAPRLSLALRVVDLSTLPEPGRRRQAESLRRVVAEAGFDLSRGPLLRVVLLRLDEREHELLLAVHHIVSDGWSVQVLIRELGDLYRELREGRPSPLAPLAIQYGDYALWQRGWLDQGSHGERQLAYWRERLAGELPVLDLPTDRPRPPVKRYRGARVEGEVPAELAGALRGLARRRSATLFMVLLAAWDLLLARLSGQDDVLVGAPVAGRTGTETEGLIGFFLNLLVLRGDLRDDPSFEALVDRVRAVALEAFTHQDVPFERLLAVLRPDRELSHTPIFQVLLNYQNFAWEQAELAGLAVTRLRHAVEPSLFDLTLYVLDGGGALKLELVYDTDLFAAARMEELLAQYLALLAQVAERPGERVGAYSLVTARARAVLPDPRAPLPEREWVGPVHELYARAAHRHPDRLAVIDAEGAWSYRALDEASGRLAARLRAAGIGPGEAVAIYAHRSASLAWALLGVLKAGAAFLLLDPSHPPLRLVDILERAAPRGWLALEAAGPPPAAVSASLAARSGLARITLPRRLDAWPEGRLDDGPAAIADSRVGPDDLACLAFTSGSTGGPKGIVGRHGPLTYFVPWQIEHLGFSDRDRFSMLSGLSHDPLQRDVFTPFSLGATLAVPEPAEVGTPSLLRRWMRRSRITVAHMTPALAQVLTEGSEEDGEALPELCYVMLTGDVVTAADLARLERLAPGATCVGFYGSTETQRSASFYVATPGSCRPGGKAVLPLGRPPEGVQLLVLAPGDRLAGIGELGEICFRSRHLARGYLGDEELTRHRFPGNPFGEDPGDRLYRTGDLGRHLPDGTVAFHGRADGQVQIRGFRVEPEEIEALLASAPGVHEAVVLVREGERASDRRLVAYVTVRAGAADGEGLRRYLRERLPAYMVPASFVFLEELPLTPNRKVDRRALLALDDGHRDLAAPPARPASESERLLVGLFEEVVGVDRVGVDDNFFDLGGSSLLLVQLHSRLRERLGREVLVVDLFDHPTVRSLAAFLDGGAEEPSAAPRLRVAEARRSGARRLVERRGRSAGGENRQGAP